MALKTAAPAIDSFAGQSGQNVNGLAHGFDFFRRQLPGFFMVVTMARNVMAGGMNRPHGVWKPFSQSAADDKRRLEVVFLQNTQDAPDPDSGAILPPGVLFGIDPAFGIRLQSFGSLIIENEIDCATIGRRPFELF